MPARGSDGAEAPGAGAEVPGWRSMEAILFLTLLRVLFVIALLILTLPGVEKIADQASQCAAESCKTNQTHAFMSEPDTSSDANQADQ